MTKQTFVCLRDSGHQCKSETIELETYFDEGEFADDTQRVVVNDDLAVMINPTLTTEQVMNTRRSFVPRV